MTDNDHLFTDQTSPKLTFIIGIVGGVALMTLSGIGFFWYVFSGGSVGTYEVAPLIASQDLLAEPVQEITTRETTKIKEPDQVYVYGADTDYSVTLVQYVDYECRFCKKYFPEVIDFVDQNESVRLIVKQFPLTKIHPQAKSAAIAAECASRQDKLIPYSSIIFERQNDLGDELYINVATELELDVEKFSTCLANETGEKSPVKQVENDTEEAIAVGISSQPNMIIWYEDGRLELIDGYVNQSYLESALADQL